jgi:hypothetical protein
LAHSARAYFLYKTSLLSTLIITRYCLESDEALVLPQYDGTSIERTDMPSLKVAVAHFSASVPESISQFPTWGDSHKDTSVTVGRPGGAGEDD